MNFPPIPAPDSLTRRGFLKLAGGALLAALGAHLPGSIDRALAAAQEQAPVLARVLHRSVIMRQKPSIQAGEVTRCAMDQILPVTGVTLGEDYPAYNRVWYEVNQEGYIHSGLLQPVEVSLNPVVKEIPKEGQLAEVTVPYTEARHGMRSWSEVAFRMYYSSVYWVVGVEQSSEGKFWYRVYDERLRIHTYVDAAHLRLLTAADLSPLSPQVPAGEKHLEVRLDDQIVIAYEGSQAVYVTRAATGARFRDGDFRTPKGDFQTARKRPTRHMAAGEPGIGTGFDLPGVPWVSYLTKEGVAFHGTYWHNDFGSPRSHGCINLSPAAARWIYRWTLPVVPAGEALLEAEEGTQVHIL